MSPVFMTAVLENNPTIKKKTLIIFFKIQRKCLQNDIWHPMMSNMLNLLFVILSIMSKYWLRGIQKPIYSQTNPSPPPSRCIQADVWPVISLSVGETCGHLMTQTGVMCAICLGWCNSSNDSVFQHAVIHVMQNKRNLKDVSLLTGHCRVSCKHNRHFAMFFSFWASDRELKTGKKSLLPNQFW